MRIGLLADVHANLPALRAALHHLAGENVDEILVAGDLVGYGASPNECVELLAEMGAVCVAGNHDLFMTGQLPGDRFSAYARLAAEVTGPLLSYDTRRYLSELPLHRRVGGLMMAHGSLDDPEEYVEDRQRVVELLRQMRARSPGTHSLVLGHTHHQRRVRSASVAADGRRAQLINPGSVGQSRAREARPRVRLAVVESGGNAPRFHRIHYDVPDASRRLSALGLSDRSLQHVPELRYRIGHRLPRSVRRQATRVRTRVSPSSRLGPRDGPS